MEAQTYTYTIFDADPAGSGPCAWPSHEGREAAADSPEGALAEALEQAELHGRGEYETGYVLHVVVWDADGVIAATGTHTVDAGDPEPPTEPVGYVEWEAAAGYVACCYGPDGDEPGDCYTRFGQDEAGWWWVDDGDDTQRDETYGPFAGGDDARAKAAEVAEERDESDIAGERTAVAERRRAEEEREEERRFREEEEARRAEEIDNIPGAREPVWIAVNMDGGRVHGPGTYAEIDAAVQRELAAFYDSRACGDRSYLPRSIVRGDRGIRRSGQWSTRWINS